MLTTQDYDLLTRVEKDAPMGRIMRRHWMPACMSEEVVTDGKPVRTRLLGEDMVVFRDSNGKLGCLAERCRHRGASLAFGRNEQCGLRCLYHGWKFDTDGNILEMASEPDATKLRLTVKQKSYPVHEGGGFVWVWMGAADDVRPWEPPAWAPSANTKISIVKMHTACNWAQVLEGSIDSAHSSSLHSTNMPAKEGTENAGASGGVWTRPSNDKAPRLQLQETNFGFRYAAIRKPILNPETNEYIRTTVFIAPFTVLIPPNDQYKLAQMLVPIDDVNTMFYWVAWHETKGISQAEWREFCAATVGVDLDENFRKVANLGNWFNQDREAMKRGDFTGIKGIPAQDMAMWESMGPISDRTEDYLGSSDLAVFQFRKQMIAAAKQVQQGGPVIGTTEPHIPHVKLSSFEGIVPKTTSWRTLGVSPEELALSQGKQRVA